MVGETTGSVNQDWSQYLLFIRYDTENSTHGLPQFITCCNP